MSEGSPGSGGYDCSFVEDCLAEGRASFEASRREEYSIDASPHEPAMPDVVVHPKTTAEVSAILSGANERGIPVTPRSAGSGIEGSAIPVEGGIVLSTAEMTGVEVRPADLQAVVKPGVVYDDLNDELSEYGLRFPPGISSGSLAMIGGMIATNASGLNAVRYGETRDHVRRLEVVLPDGRVIECGRDVAKTSAGYSLKDLVIGSEGTLGVVAEATLALAGIPSETRAALVTFPAPEDASRAVSEIIRYGLRPGALEFIDAPSIELINAFSGVSLPARPTLVIELHANNSGIEEDVAFARDICEDNGALRWEGAAADEMDDIWQARRDVLPAARAYREDWEVAIIGDVVVPISNYPDIVAAVTEIADDLDLLCPCVGHAGDGNLHYVPMVDPDDEAMVERAFELNDRVVERALDLRGTSTGEHGIGVGKREYMEREHGNAVDVMRDIKEVFDPNGIMNPGKVLPHTPGG